MQNDSLRYSRNDKKMVYTRLKRIWSVWFCPSHSVPCDRLSLIRDWSLITGRGGGLQNGSGGHMKFYPYEKGVAKKVLAMLKGQHKKFWGSFYAVAWSFSHIVGGGDESFHSLKGGTKRFTLSRGGGHKKIRTRHFVAPPPPSPYLMTSP